MPEVSGYDILGFGAVAVDEVIEVAAYPPPDTKTRAVSWIRRCGGNSAIALIAACRLGSVAAYGGWLGDDELSEFVRLQLRSNGVETGPSASVPGTRPLHSVVIVDSAARTRNVFFDLGAAGKGEASRRQIRAVDQLVPFARAVLIDTVRLVGMIRIARLARQAGVPVIADVEYLNNPNLPVLLRWVDHLILPLRAARELSGRSNPAEAARALWRPGHRCVAVTAGADGVWFLLDSAGTTVLHQPAFRVQAVDTTGCGDVFHGAYAHALAHQASIQDAIRFASAAAAAMAERDGTDHVPPMADQVEALLRAQPDVVASFAT
jgi:sugar/nucleoside kinase (ribokinase family)